MTDRVTQVLAIDLGPTRYRDAWAWQRNLLEARVAGQLPDLLLFTEHPPVYTYGRRTGAENLLHTADEYQRLGAELVPVDRGGDVTFHGPGQVVGYPILALGALKKDLHWYVRTLEESLIQTCAEYGIDAWRVDGRTGVWTRGGKIAAIGIRVSRWVTMHGFAFNLDVDLGWFDQIVPCGIADAPVTSMAALGRPIGYQDWCSSYAKHFAAAFGVSVQMSGRSLIAPYLVGEPYRLPDSPAAAGDTGITPG